MQGEPVDTKEAPRTSSSGKGEKHTETQKKCARGETIDDVTEAAGHICDVLMAVEIKDTDLLHTVNTSE